MRGDFLIFRIAVQIIEVGISDEVEQPSLSLFEGDLQIMQGLLFVAQYGVGCGDIVGRPGTAVESIFLQGEHTLPHRPHAT